MAQQLRGTDKSVQRASGTAPAPTDTQAGNGGASASSVDTACAAIREAIRSGRFAGGDRSREVEVCALARVSRTSVR